MGAIREQTRWIESLYRIQTNDRVHGGQDGVINIQPAQVASRTAWLRSILELEHTPDGKHDIMNGHVADDAAIAEEKLALVYPTRELHEALTAARFGVDRLRGDIAAVIGDDGFYVQGFSKMARLNWRYLDFGFEFEFWDDGLTMRDMRNLDSRGAVGRDDSIDCDDTSGLVAGMRLLIFDDAGSEEIEIRDVLERGRIRTTKDLSRTYDEPSVIGYTNWKLSVGSAVAHPGGVYYSRVTSVLEEAPTGRLLICRDGGEGSLVVEWRDRADHEWSVAAKADVTAAETHPGFFYDHYTIPGGNIQLRITAQGKNVNILHMALFPTPARQIVSSIRTPRLMRPAVGEEVYRDSLTLACSEFRCAYRDNFTRTEYRLVSKATGEVAAEFSTDQQRSIRDIDESRVPENGIYTVQCRQQSDIGEWSAWSSPFTVIIMPVGSFFGFAGAEKSEGFGVGRFDSLKRTRMRFGFEGCEGTVGFETGMFTTQLAD